MNTNNYLNITCKIMECVLTEKPLDLSHYYQDQLFLEIMKEQTFSPFLYELDKYKQWRSYYLQAYIIDSKINKYGQTIKQIFDENNIPHIFLKGFELKKLYPKEFLRQMGDIDVLVRVEDYKKALEILKSNNFKLIDETDYHAGLSYNGFNIELHHRLMSDTTIYGHYFENPFSEAKPTNNSTYEFNHQFNFNYLLIHYIKHLKNGAGLRELCDLYLFINKYPISIMETRELLKIENNDTFVDTLLTELFYIFNYSNFQFTENKSFIKLLEYSLISGIHGFGKNSERTKNEFIQSKKSKLGYLIQKLFIKPKELFKVYPWTKTIILIPFGYIVRLLHLLINKRKKLEKVLSVTEKDKILIKMGINN